MDQDNQQQKDTLPSIPTNPITPFPSLPQTPIPSVQVKVRRSTALLKMIWQDALFPFLCTRVLLVVIGFLSIFYILPLLLNNPILPNHQLNMQFPQALWRMWNRFDSGFYLYIAHHGYDSASSLHTRSNWAFYPLYPLLISSVARLFGDSNETYILAGLFVANVSALVAVIYLYLLVHKEFGRQVASRVSLFLGLFPISFYLTAIYTEALFLALAIATIYYARKRSWWLAGACGGLAALTRSQGVMLVIPLAWEYLRVIKEPYISSALPLSGSIFRRLQVALSMHLHALCCAAKKLKHWGNALSLLLVPLGLLLFMLYAQIQIGDFMATFHTSQWGWGRQLTYPWRVLIKSLQNPILADPMNWNFWMLNMLAVFSFFGIIFWSFRRLPGIYTLYCVVMILLPLSSNMLNSIQRYCLIIFPAFILLALWSNHEKRSDTSRMLLIALFAVLQAVLTIFFILGLPAMA